jgi:mannose-6-phosphate isomerase-like protein (cupin superfamily)
MPVAVTHLLGPDQGEVVHLLALGVRFMIDGERTGGAFSLVEHPLPPRALGAPLHTHHNEDEYSFVLQGRFGVQLGDDTLEAGPGDLLFKPRRGPACVLERRGRAGAAAGTDLPGRVRALLP